jgi:hypothetical protein
MDAQDPPAAPPPGTSKPRTPRRRLTKLEKEAREAEIAKSNATVQDIRNEARHRRVTTWITGAAIIVTAVLSVASCSATANETRSMEQIAAQERARDRDEKRAACTEQYMTGVTSALGLAVDLQETDAGLDAAETLRAVEDLGHATVRCISAGMVVDEAREPFGDAMTALVNSITEPKEDQQVALEALMRTAGEYMDVDIATMAELFETPTGSE